MGYRGLDCCRARAVFDARVLSFRATIEELLIIARMKRAPTSTATTVDAQDVTQSRMVQSICRPRVRHSLDRTTVIFAGAGSEERNPPLYAETLPMPPGPPRVRGRADLDRPGDPGERGQPQHRDRSRETKRTATAAHTDEAQGSGLAKDIREPRTMTILSLARSPLRRDDHFHC